ncbi:hypothetical protein KY289_011660 [Solanum tuberosum]|nr:hypothetical protein KY289_011660 [Solanum tuberosum]
MLLNCLRGIEPGNDPNPPTQTCLRSPAKREHDMLDCSRAGRFQREGDTVVGKLPNAGQTVIRNGKKVEVFEGTSKDGSMEAL